ncbi:MAG: hypothetical protein JKY81_00165 [Colwellia sp.]|nr:hypothetical protein [Colwellia sp.]
MSLATNKLDFEKALDEMKSHIEALESCIKDEIMSTLTKVIDEYEIHYKSDVEELIDVCESINK